MPGVLYTGPATRIIGPTGLIKYFGLDYEIHQKDEVYHKYFPLGKLPALRDADGFILTETIAVCLYLIKQGDPNSPMLGKNDRELATIIRYASLANSDIKDAVVEAFAGVVGRVPYNKKVVEGGRAKLFKYTQILEDRLYNFTYLVGETPTLADIITVQTYTRVFSHVFGEEERKKFPNVTKWFKTMTTGEILGDQYKDFTYPEKAAEYVPPNKEKKEKKEPVSKTAANSAPQPEAAPAPKQKHPLESLGKPKAPLDEWKRVYSNEETRESAIPWFWKNQYDSEEWSSWRVDYKYNNELTMTFMSNNLVGGFFNRLSASTKYLFGAAVVYGENNANGITGFFLVRGQEIEPAVNVAPDWESYSFTKLDASSEEDKKFINNMLAWDEPVVIDGVAREIADGKVFK